MKKISSFKLLCSSCLLIMTGCALAYTITFINRTDSDNVIKTDSVVDLKPEYSLSNTFVEKPTSETILENLIIDFGDDFNTSSINDLNVTVLNNNQATITAKSYSNTYSGSAIVKWNLTELINLSSVNGATFAINPVYSKDKEVYSIADLTTQQVASLIYKQSYSQAFNFNQIVLTINEVTQSATLTPKPNSTVYAQGTNATANMNVSSVASLTYTYPTLSQTRTSTGSPTFTYRGSVKTATYNISEGGYTSPLSFSSDGVLTLTTNSNFNGGIYNITGSYIDTDGVTYKASFAVLVQQYIIPVLLTNTNVMTLASGITQQGGGNYTKIYQSGKIIIANISLAGTFVANTKKLCATFTAAYAPTSKWWGFGASGEGSITGSGYVNSSNEIAVTLNSAASYCDFSFTYVIA